MKSLTSMWMHTAAEEEPELSPRQQQAIQALLSARSYIDVARQVGCSPSTLRRWLRDEVFLERYRQARHEINSRCATLVQTTTLRGCKILDEIIHDSKAPAFARIQALRLAKEWARDGYEMEHLEDRLTVLSSTARQTERDNS